MRRKCLDIIKPGNNQMKMKHISFYRNYACNIFQGGKLNTKNSNVVFLKREFLLLRNHRRKFFSRSNTTLFHLKNC